MPDFGIFRGFNEKLFGDKLYAGQLPINLGMVESDFFKGLLDFYPNAAAAYSLRKLRDAYTGSAIRVRRTNLDELDIGFTALGELDTAALLAFTGTGALDNGFVTTWYDQSGNARNATQTTALNQPQIVSSGSLIINNSKVSVRFNSSNSTRLTTTSFNLLNPIRIFTYFNTLSNNTFVFDGLSVNQYRVFISSDTSMTLYGNGFGLTEPIYSDNTGIINKNYLSDSLINSNSSSWTINNNNPINFSVGNSTVNLLNLGIAGNNIRAFNGFIHEFIIYNSTESANANAIRNNINDFYSIY
jgi:hypothetical protein